MIVLVTWDDAAAEHDQHEESGFPPVLRVQTHGVLTKETETAVWVTGEVLSRGADLSVAYRCTTVIPRTCIASIQELEVKT